MRRPALHGAALVAALLFAAAPGNAQGWIAVGPPGGNVRALAADPRDPQRLYLGTVDGLLYRSDDDGAHWRRPNPGFPLRRCALDQVVIDARGTVYVGYWEVQGSGGGVARSSDGGETFAVLPGIAGESVRALAVSPADPSVVAAGARSGVFLSSDAGRTWNRVSPGDDPDLRNVESLAFDPRDPRVLYAGTWHLGWKTTDAGAHWAPVHDGMIDDSDVMTLTVDPADPQTVYATACSGIYRSEDGATLWRKLAGIPFASRRTRAFSQGSADPALLLAGTTGGLWVSEDGGGAWRLATSATLVVNAALVQADGSILLGAEGAGVLRSADRGRTWSASNAGFSERFVSTLLFDPASRRLVIGVWGDGGVFATAGVRGPWVRMGEGLEGRQVLSLALAGDVLLAGTDDGIFARAPRAATWHRLAPRAGRDPHPRVTELVALSARRLLAGTAQGLLASADGGATWTAASPLVGDAVLGLALLHGAGGAVVVATSAGFFGRENGGAWRPVSPLLPGATVHALTALDRRALFATTTAGLFRSDDRGAHWQRVGGGLPSSNLMGIAIHPDRRTIYVSDFNRGGLFRSADGGRTWTGMPTGDLPSDRVWSLGLDPAAPGQVLASSASGLYLLAQEPVTDAEPGGP